MIIKPGTIVEFSGLKLELLLREPKKDPFCLVFALGRCIYDNDTGRYSGIHYFSEQQLSVAARRIFCDKYLESSENKLTAYAIADALTDLVMDLPGPKAEDERLRISSGASVKGYIRSLTVTVSDLQVFPQTKVDLMMALYRK